MRCLLHIEQLACEMSITYLKNFFHTEVMQALLIFDNILREQFFANNGDKEYTVYLYSLLFVFVFLKLRVKSVYQPYFKLSFQAGEET